MTNPVNEVAAAVRSGATTARATVDDHLARIAARDQALNSFVHVDAAGARAQADAVDAQIAAGRAGPLAGVPIGLKDIFSTRGVPTTCASRVLEGYVPPFDATVVRRLRDAGAVFVGKLNMDEFAMGSSNENSAFGAVRNPWAVDRVPGGSSGGSAAAVAAQLCAGALGTDTGGSIRQPAAMCGVVGFKPTYGRCSRFGVIAFASSLDQPGPLARSVRDAALLYRVMAGVDPHDATSADRPVGSLDLDGGVAGLRIGVPEEYFAVDGLDPAVRAAVEQALAWFEGNGAELVPVHLPSTDEAVAAYYLVATAEASSNLARYDGVRFGPRGAATTLQAMYAETRAAFGPEVKRRLLLGTFALSSGYYDAYYGKACAARARVRADFEAAWTRCDLIAAPTSPGTAFPLGERVDDPLSMYLADVFTIPASLAGLPGISVPCGFAAGLPVGLQLIGRGFDESTVLRAAAAFEDGTDWRRTPEVAS